MSENYEDLDPDNQNRSSDYYLGVYDAARYFMDLMADVAGTKGDIKSRLDEAMALGEELYTTCEDRRRMFFWNHMNAGQLKRHEIRRPERATMEAGIMAESRTDSPIGADQGES